jgi:hypothetical protein
MPRNVTVTLSSGETLQFADVPDDVTPDQIQARAESESGGASVVSIDGGQSSAPPAGAAPTGAAPADAVPMDDVAPQAPQEDIAGYEAGLRDLYQQYSEKKRPFAAADIESLASKYNLQGRISNIPQIQEFFEKYGTLNPSLVSVAPDAPLPEAVKQDEIIGTVPQGGENTQRVRAFGKGVLFDFADELEAGARMLASGQMSSDEYYRLKTQINDDYNAWAKANPGEALALEAAGGIAGSFVPGIGIVGKGYQAATGIGKVAGVGARAALVGGSTGALSGIGQAKTLGDIPQSLLENAALGAAFSAPVAKVLEYGGRGVNTAAQRLREKYGPGIEVLDDVTGEFVRVPEIPLTAADRKAAEILTGAGGEGGIQRAVTDIDLANQQRVPLTLGTANRELTALTEKVAARPSLGQEQLVQDLVETRIATPDRMSATFKEALPGAGDFFDEQQAVTDRLRAIGNDEYQKAFEFGPVRDPKIDEVIFNPELANIWKEAQRQARLDKRELKVALEPVFDEGGSLVGSRPTGDVIPDVETLHSFKRQLDTAITAAFRRGAGDEGTSLKKLRDQMVGRLDALVPDYKVARGKYRGDLEVRKAMDDGLKILSSTVQAKQLRKSFTDMSDAEKEAFKTGALEAVTRNIDGSKGGNLANRLAGAKANIEKFEALMGPEEAKFFKRIIAQEKQLYERTSKITGGSRTTPLAEGLDALDVMIQKGNLGEVVNLLLAGPSGVLPAFGRFVAKLNPRKEFGEQVYSKLSRALSARKPEELGEVLDMLRRSQSYTDYMTSVKNAAAGRAAAVTGATAPSMFEDRSFAPPPPTEVEPDPEAQLQNYIASGGLGTAIGDGAAMDEAAMQEGMAAEETTAQAPGTVMMNNRYVEEGPDGRMYYLDDNTPAEGISLGMYRGGSVQAFNKGGQAKKQTSWYDDLTMAVSRRGNDLVATVADLADKYGLTPADATAWVAQNVAGYSPQQAAQIRKNLGGMSNRAMVNAGAASNETRFRNSGGVGARPANMVTPPVRMSDVAYRVQDIPRAVISETPKALRAAGNYLTNTAPQTMLRDAQRAGSVAINAIAEDPYGMAFDTALYPAFPVAASAGDFAAIRGGARELSPYVRDNAEAAQTKAMVDALSVLPIGGGMAGRRLTKKR